MNTGRPHFIGVDLGGTMLRAACIAGDGRVIRSARQATVRDGGPDKVLAQMESLVASVRDAATAAIGVGVPGAFDAATGAVLGIPALSGWRGFPLAPQLAGRTGLPCVLENDATAAAIGEWRIGAGRGCEHFVYVTISTGIGAGVIIDGRVLRGALGLAGEVGHTRIADCDEPCSCGQSGCWESVASGTALGRRASRVAQSRPNGLIATLASQGQANAVHVGVAARRGDPDALALIDAHARWLGLGFVNVQHTFAPERIVMGGGLAALLDLMAPRIEAVMKSRRLPGFPSIAVVAAELADDAGFVGAALCARDRLEAGDMSCAGA